jgi:hypothetical protein
MKGLKIRTLFLFVLGWTATAFGVTCPGGPVSVDLTSPSGSGAYSTPLNFQGTASSTAGSITGYAVYTNAWSDIPFAEGQPMYLNGIATLNAWVILPLSSSGGALAQSVFVRAWDSAGNCHDSSTLSITRQFPVLFQRTLNPGITLSATTRIAIRVTNQGGGLVEPQPVRPPTVPAEQTLQKP